MATKMPAVAVARLQRAVVAFAYFASFVWVRGSFSAGKDSIHEIGPGIGWHPVTLLSADYADYTDEAGRFHSIEHAGNQFNGNSNLWNRRNLRTVFICQNNTARCES